MRVTKSLAIRAALFVGIFAMLLYVRSVWAYYPIEVFQESITDVPTIENPTKEQYFFGSLIGFPHTYTISTESIINLYIEIRIPDIPLANNNISGIVVREKLGGGVEEVARLHAYDASWERVYEPWSNDWYRLGPVLNIEVPAGVYRVEFSTPDNLEKYTLRIGATIPADRIGYIEKLQRIIDIKKFFGKSTVSVLQSPHVYVPFAGVIGIVVLLTFWRRKKK